MIGVPWWLKREASAHNVGDPGLILGEGNGSLLQYSCLENPVDGGAWWATVHGVTKSRTQLNDFTSLLHFRGWNLDSPYPCTPGSYAAKNSTSSIFVTQLHCLLFFLFNGILHSASPGILLHLPESSQSPCELRMSKAWKDGSRVTCPLRLSLSTVSSGQAACPSSRFLESFPSSSPWELWVTVPLLSPVTLLWTSKPPLLEGIHVFLSFCWIFSIFSWERLVLLETVCWEDNFNFPSCLLLPCDKESQS